MRDFFEVIDVIIGYVPEENGLKNTLIKLKEDAFYTPPERMGDNWALLGVILEKHLGRKIPTDKNSWEYKIYSKLVLDI
jgi:hypothetical protein